MPGNEDAIPAMQFEEAEDQEEEVIVLASEEEVKADQEKESNKPSYEDLVKQYQAAQQQIEQLQSGSDSAIERLAERLEGSQGQKQQNFVQQPKESEEDFKKRIQEALFSDDPTKAIDEVIERKMQPVVAQYAQSNIELQKQLFRIDPKDGDFFKKHEDEILKSIPPEHANNPQAIKYYTDICKVKNIDELVELKVEERLKSSKASSKENFVPGSFNPQPPTRKVKKISLSKSEERELHDSGVDYKSLIQNGLDPRKYLRNKGGK